MFRRGKGSTWFQAVVLTCFVLVSTGVPQGAFALPQGGVVPAGGGSAAISQPNATTMHINQATQKAIINWNSYGIAGNELVQYFQPNAAAVALNRVVGVDPSVILGQLKANGQIFLVNPNGILFGAGAKVDVAGLLATTFTITDDNFMSGNYSFAKDPLAAPSYVVNRGQIRIADNGFAILAAPSISNEGLIIAKMGKVVVGAGADSFTVPVDFWGDGLVTFAVNGTVASRVTGPDGQPMFSPITNTGTVQAEGGQVLLTADAAKGVFSSVINQAGIVEAKSLVAQSGRVVLAGGSTGDPVVNDGRIDVSGKEWGAKGGTIEVTGDTISGSGQYLANANGDAKAGSVSLVSTAGTGLASGTVIQANGRVDDLYAPAITIWSDGPIALEGATISAVTTKGTDATSGSISIMSGHYDEFGGVVGGGTIDITNSKIYSAVQLCGADADIVKAQSGYVEVNALAGNVNVAGSQLYSLAEIRNLSDFHQAEAVSNYTALAASGNISVATSQVYSLAQLIGVGNYDCEDVATATSGDVYFLSGAGGVTLSGTIGYTKALIDGLEDFDKVTVTATSGNVGVDAGGASGISLFNSDLYSYAKATNLDDFRRRSSVTATSQAVSLTALEGGITATNSDIYSRARITNLSDMPKINLFATSGPVTLSAGGDVNLSSTYVYSRAELTNFNSLDYDSKAISADVSVTAANITMSASEVYSKAYTAELSDLNNVGIESTSGGVSLQADTMNLQGSKVYSSAEIVGLDDIRGTFTIPVTAASGDVALLAGTMNLSASQVYSSAKIADLSNFDEVTVAATSGDVTLDATTGGINLAGASKIYSSALISDFNNLDFTAQATAGDVTISSAGDMNVTGGGCATTAIYSAAKVDDLWNLDNVTIGSGSGAVSITTQGNLSLDKSQVYSSAIVSNLGNIDDITITAASGGVGIIAGSLSITSNSKIYSLAQLYDFNNLDYISKALAGAVQVTTTGDIFMDSSQIYSLAKVSEFNGFSNVDITAKSFGIQIGAGGGLSATGSSIYSLAQVSELSNFRGYTNVTAAAGNISVAASTGDIGLSATDLYTSSKIANLSNFQNVDMTATAGDISLAAPTGNIVAENNSAIYSLANISNFNNLDYTMDATSGVINMAAGAELGIFSSQVYSAAKVTNMWNLDDAKIHVTSGAINMNAGGNIWLDKAKVYSQAAASNIDMWDVDEMTVVSGDINLSANNGAGFIYILNKSKIETKATAPRGVVTDPGQVFLNGIVQYTMP